MPPAVRADLAANTAVCKFNIGTELRRAFGAALRASVASDPDRFDRAQILKDVEPAVMRAARVAIGSVRPLESPGTGI